ncbi:hypothetical protein GCM10007052_17780 [Halioglobus japonicus]|nr:hypothetical protein GCM10007052_17780 [Halioglobus japonicus]
MSDMGPQADVHNAYINGGHGVAVRMPVLVMVPELDIHHTLIEIGYCYAIPDQNIPSSL